MRLAEYELREYGIAVSGTPDHAGSCPAWMQMGFDLYRKLEKMGFVKYSGNDTAKQVLETHPHACFCVLTETIPQPKPSLEGRLQRQLVLLNMGCVFRTPWIFLKRSRVIK
jgi:predicted RNase H-like nuclease